MGLHIYLYVDPETLAQNISMHHVEMLLDQYKSITKHNYAWIFRNIILRHYIAKGVRIR